MMNMRREFIAGNWKMYTTAATAERLAEVIADGMGAEARVSVAACPPFPCCGSVKLENAAGLLRQPDVDGALISGACLHAEQFMSFVRTGIGEPQNKGGPA